MKLEQVAIQLFTLREFCKTAEDYATTLKRVTAIGYQAIQISAVGPIPTSELRSIAEGEGLTICATHEPALTIVNEPQRVADRLCELGCKYTAYPSPVGVDFYNAQAVFEWIAQLDAAGAVLRKAGRVLTYHNHSSEFAHIEGRPILSWIYEKTAPENLQAELDTYWVQAGGASPEGWCEKLAGRLPLLHIKDYSVTPERVPQFAEIGYGNLDFPRIISAADKAGCEWYIVEQDTCPGDPFVSIEKSFNYIKENLVS